MAPSAGLEPTTT